MTASPASKPTVDIVIPVYNEQHSLPRCVERLRPFCQAMLDAYRWRIVIADNGSVDDTHQVAVAQHLLFPEEVDIVHLDQKGRGRALKRTWLGSEADIVCYMDVDLSTELEALPVLLGAIRAGFDVATGSRLKKGAKTARSLKREITSRGYNLLVRLFFQTKFSDAQCGFKAASRRAVQELVPLIENNNWFFDSELLILAEKKGYKVFDLPVAWVEDPDTRVKIVRTALEDIRGLLRLRFGGIPGGRKE
ncbi:MAG: glycosyltransferase [Chloroflexi bacterium]|nr:glycosyltransferase [Chloroflexota bacterium]